MYLANVAFGPTHITLNPPRAVGLPTRPSYDRAARWGQVRARARNTLKPYGLHGYFRRERDRERPPPRSRRRVLYHTRQARTSGAVGATLGVALGAAGAKPFPFALGGISVVRNPLPGRVRVLLIVAPGAARPHCSPLAEKRVGDPSDRHLKPVLIRAPLDVEAVEKTRGRVV